MYTQALHIAELDSLVRAYFQVEDWILDLGWPVYFIKPVKNLDSSFKALCEKLQPLGLTPTLRRVRGRVALRIIPLPRRKHRGRLLALSLFIATLGTILAAGYLITVLDEVLRRLDPTVALNPLPHLLGYAVAMVSIVGIHELGHKIACKVHGVKASPPLFIPFPPIPWFPIGTLGALIMQESPPLRRNDLFDIGISGPLFGFLISIIVSAIGLSLSYPIPAQLIEEMEQGGVSLQFLPTPLIYEALIPLVRPDLTEASLIYLHPVAWAGWVGFLITFLNTFPVGQLDGGHVLRAAVNEKLHLILSVLFIVVMVVMGFLVMAILAAFIALRGHPGALNDVSPLSNLRKLGLILLFVMWIASLPVPLMLWL